MVYSIKVIVDKRHKSYTYIKDIISSYIKDIVINDGIQYKGYRH